MTRPAWRLAIGVGMLLGLWCLTACRTPDLSAFDAASLEWQIVEGQAVWQPAADAPAIAGDLVIGTHPEQLVLISFSKGPVPIATVRCSPAAWEFQSAPLHRNFRGHGLPPPRLAWFILARELLGAPMASGWESVVEPGGVRRLSSSRTGESLELHLPP